MLYKDIPSAAALKAALERYSVDPPLAAQVANVVISEGAACKDVSREWFDDDGPASVRQAIRQWLRAKRAAIKAELAALDTGIAADVAGLPE